MIRLLPISLIILGGLLLISGIALLNKNSISKPKTIFEDPVIQKRISKSIHSYNEGKTLKLTDDQLKKLLGI
jgi:hypothetical protein